VQWAVAPGANGRFRVKFATSHAFIGTTTAAHPVQVIPYFRLASLHTASQFSATQIRGSIHPRLTGRVYLQRYVDHRWVAAGHSALAGGHFAFTISPSDLGALTYRVARSSHALYASSTSSTLRVQVVHRTLTLGASGPDVRTLQRRLAKLHYDIGPINGQYGTDTLHAVTAFQKVNGLTKDGQTGPDVWSRLNHPKVPHLKHPDPSASLAVEVNIPKQILLLARYGKIWRILDTSTAGGYLYTNSEGGQSRAVTPRGHFTIQYKITGWHKSKLGEMYYPSYFNYAGDAIHGEGNSNAGSDVPPYPNSHGCVRITNNAVLRYYSMLVDGTSVWIY
jgi:N-acetylmuramoyl-L-alanine amidase